MTSLVVLPEKSPLLGKSQATKLEEVEHSRFDEVLTLQAAVLPSADGLVETVRRNAPSYSLPGSA